MPVFLDRGELGYRAFAAAAHLRGKSVPKYREGEANCITLGLINNMPDSALETTERQILKLLDAAAEDVVVRLKLYSLPGIPRAEFGLQHVSKFYHGVSKLYASHIDGLIITGTEPRARSLVEEPYWTALTEVLDWAERHTISTILSCLAVHAAVLHIDGIDRHMLQDKRFGVFEFERVSTHPIIGDAPSRLAIPHSRWNEVREHALQLSGYTILTRSEQSGVDMFLKKQRSLFLFFQGHPEYEAGTLLREYRRDIGRFLRGETDIYPTMPRGYFNHQAEEALNVLRARAIADRREELLADFPTALVAEKLEDTWRSAATRIYRNWITYMSAQKDQRLKGWSLGSSAPAH